MRRSGQQCEDDKVTMHDIYYLLNPSQHRYDVLPFAIQTLKAKGYNFVTMSECLGIDAYLSTVAPEERDVWPSRCFFERPLIHLLLSRPLGRADM